jgi:predicted nucleotidyltransferase
MQKARFLNREKVIGQLTGLAGKAMAEDGNIKRVILFGSLAEDTFSATSDADLLVILGESDRRLMDRIPDLLFYFLDAPVPVEVFPYTEGEVENIPLAKRAVEKGIVLCGG